MTTAIKSSAPFNPRVSTAWQITLRDGRQIWVPAVGRPFWTDRQPTKDLTDDEIKEFIKR